MATATIGGAFQWDFWIFSLAEVKAIAEHGGEWSAQQFGLPWGWWERTKRMMRCSTTDSCKRGRLFQIIGNFPMSMVRKKISAEVQYGLIHPEGIIFE